MNKISCHIIKDLLPLYHDDVCSNDSRKLIEEHIAECKSCKDELNAIHSDINLTKYEKDLIQKDSEEIYSVSKMWNKSKKKSFIKGVIIALVIFISSFLVYQGLFCWNIVPIGANTLEVSEVSQLEDGRIAYKFKKDNNYPLFWITTKTDKEGNKYITHKRSILKLQNNDENITDMYWCFEIPSYDNNNEPMETKAIYIGSKKDKKLVWEKGMTLPKASKEAEEILSPPDGTVN